MRDYAERGKHPGPLPAPGVFARHNAVDTPALLPDGTPVRAVDLAGAAGPRHGHAASGQRRDVEAERIGGSSDDPADARTTTRRDQGRSRGR